MAFPLPSAMYPRPAFSVPTPRKIFYRTLQEPVRIKHPGVDESLLSFPVLSTGDADIPFGVSRSLVQDACRVLTNRAENYQGDFLAFDSKGQNPIGDNVTLLERDCYYFVGLADDEANKNYPIVKTLSAFSFPSVLPGPWKEIADTLRQSHTSSGQRLPASSQMSGDVGRRDCGCVTTRCPSATQCAYIIPKSEEDWYLAQNLGIYVDGISPPGINHPANGLSLRADVHVCLDSHAFVFYPDNDPVNGPRFVAYFVRGGWSFFYTDLLHRRPAAIHPEIPTEFLYARFAYAIINQPRWNHFASVDKWDEVNALQGQKQSGKKTGMAQGSGSALGSISEGGGDSDVEMSGTRGQTHAAGNGDKPGVHSPSTSSNQSVRSPQEETAEGNARWRKLFSQLPEIEDPPDTFTGSHVETPHMMRLRSEYIKEHPQVWRTSTTPANATREDVEGFYADWLTRPV